MKNEFTTNTSQAQNTDQDGMIPCVNFWPADIAKYAEIVGEIINEFCDICGQYLIKKLN